MNHFCDIQASNVLIWLYSIWKASEKHCCLVKTSATTHFIFRSIFPPQKILYLKWTHNSTTRSKNNWLEISWIFFTFVVVAVVLDSKTLDSPQSLFCMWATSLLSLLYSFSFRTSEFSRRLNGDAPLDVVYCGCSIVRFPLDVYLCINISVCEKRW